VELGSFPDTCDVPLLACTSRGKTNYYTRQALKFRLKTSQPTETDNKGRGKTNFDSFDGYYPKWFSTNSKKPDLSIARRGTLKKSYYLLERQRIATAYPRYWHTGFRRTTLSRHPVVPQASFFYCSLVSRQIIATGKKWWLWDHRMSGKTTFRSLS